MKHSWLWPKLPSLGGLCCNLKRHPLLYENFQSNSRAASLMSRIPLASYMLPALCAGSDAPSSGHVEPDAAPLPPTVADPPSESLAGGGGLLWEARLAEGTRGTGGGRLDDQEGLDGEEAQPLRGVQQPPRRAFAAAATDEVGPQGDPLRSSRARRRHHRSAAQGASAQEGSDAGRQQAAAPETARAGGGEREEDAHGGYVSWEPDAGRQHAVRGEPRAAAGEGHATGGERGSERHRSRAHRDVRAAASSAARHEAPAGTYAAGAEHADRAEV